MDLRDRVIWLTGASSGIGEALAHALHREGARLILSSRDVDRLRRVKGACVLDAPVEVLPLDLSRSDTLPAAAGRAERLFGPVEVMIHNAGVAQRARAVETREEVERRIMETNYFGAVILTKALLPGMLERGRGHLVVVTSLTGLFGLPLLSTYAASKHALHGYFESLRAEVRRAGVRVTIVVPGIVRTEITRRALTATGEPAGKELAVQRRGMDPERCARRIVKAVRKEREVALVGGPEIWAVHLNRWFPGLFRRLIRNHPLRRLRRLTGLGRRPGSDRDRDRGA